MQWKVIVALIGLLIVAALAYVILASLAPEPAPSSFRGPTGQPYVRGPSGPPPSSNQ